MKIICRLLLAMACLCLANISWATVCANSTGVAEDEHYDLSNIFNSTNNQPGQIVVLPEKSGWACIERSIKDIVKEGHIGMAVRRLWAKSKHKKYLKTLSAEEKKNDSSIFLYVSNAVESDRKSVV